jgi:hypothetical protein
VIVGAALLVLLGLGLFVAGILTGLTVFYWGCVGACVAAAVLLIAARRQIGRRAAAAVPATASAPAKRTAPGEPAPAADGVLEEPAPADEVPADKAPAHQASAVDLPDPGVEDVEVTDLLMVVDLKDEVLVVDEHPRYHVAGCRWLAGRETIPLPLDEARTDGFTPCAVCSPDRTLAERARARRHKTPDA